MNLKIDGGVQSLSGEVSAPSSKSYSHRAFILASLAEGPSKIHNPLTTGDVQVTLNILTDLGVNISRISEDTYSVNKREKFLKQRSNILDCKNSGTSIRIFTALSLLVEGGLTFTGTFLSKKRPILPLLNALDALGAEYTLKENFLRIARKKKLCEPISIPGDISSQFITALLITCPLISCRESDNITIRVTTPLTSFPYIKITEEVLNSFGGRFKMELEKNMTGTFHIPLQQKLKGQQYFVPGDFSSAAFLICAAVLSSKNDVVINNLNMNSPQGDKKIIEILVQMGAKIKIEYHENQVIIQGNIENYPLEGIEIDCKDIPDLFPILSVMGACAKGTTTLYNASSLRLKESDRIAVMARELKKMGVNLEEKVDKMIIHHCPQLKGANFEHENDHRIAMACIIAALHATSSSMIQDIEIIIDSYPSFIEDLKKLNAKIEMV